MGMSRKVRSGEEGGCGGEGDEWGRGDVLTFCVGGHGPIGLPVDVTSSAASASEMALGGACGARPASARGPGRGRGRGGGRGRALAAGAAARAPRKPCSVARAGPQPRPPTKQPQGSPPQAATSSRPHASLAVEQFLRGELSIPNETRWFVGLNFFH